MLRNGHRFYRDMPGFTHSSDGIFDALHERPILLRECHLLESQYFRKFILNFGFICLMKVNGNIQMKSIRTRQIHQLRSLKNKV